VQLYLFQEVNSVFFHKQPPIFKTEPAIEKIVEGILFLVNLASKRNQELTQYDIVKSLFLADKSHLNKYGRPVTFDNYVAMEHGPVPSFAYSVLKHDCDVRMFNPANSPWDRVDGAHPTNPRVMYFKNPKRQHSVEILSDSDVEALGSAYATAKSLTFGQLRKLTHDDPAYIVAWGDGESQNAPMSYGMLFDTPDFEEAEQVQFASQHI
jgi:uncharacterized phage-associated protein